MYEYDFASVYDCSCYHLYILLLLSLPMLGISININQYNMSERCDRDDISKTARDKESALAKCIPFTPTPAIQKSIVEAQIARTLLVERMTAKFLLQSLLALDYYQDHIHAGLGSNSPGFNRLGCNIHSDGVNYRKDINEDNPSKLGICDNNAANIKILSLLHMAIIMYLVEVLGMHPEDGKYVVYYSFLWLIGSGMGLHGDSPNKVKRELFFLRLSIQIGEGRKINFKAFKFEGNDETANHVYNGISIDSLEMREGADAYAMSTFSSGKFPLFWNDSQKNVGVQLKHEVGVTKTGNAMNIILDVPFRSLEAMMQALKIFRLTPFVLPTEKSMDAYKLLVKKVQEMRKAWN